MDDHRDSIAARRIALGLELGVATARDLAGDGQSGGAAESAPKSVADRIAAVGARLYTILFERLGDAPDRERIRRAQREAREICDLLRGFRRSGVDEDGIPLSIADRLAIDRLLHDVAFILAQVFDYSARERVELRTSVLGETPAEAVEHVRRQDTHHDRNPSWRWSLDDDERRQP